MCDVSDSESEQEVLVEAELPPCESTPLLNATLGPPLPEDGNSPDKDRLTSGKLIGYLLLVVAPSVLLWFITFESMARWWSFLTSGYVLYVIWQQFQRDNSHTEFFQVDNREVLIQALVNWSLVFAIILPGIVLVYTVDTFFDNGLRTVEIWTHQAHQSSAQSLDETIATLQGKRYNWFWPPNWHEALFDKMKLSILNDIRENAVQPSDGSLRFFWSLVYFVVSIFQTLSWAFIFYLLVRSFLWIWMRTWLCRDGATVQFTLAAKNA